MNKDNLTKFARMLKERDPFIPPNITTGVLINPPPNPKVKLNDIIILEKGNLVFSSNLIVGYKRNIKFEDTDCGVTNTVGDPSHSHIVKSLDVDTVMEWTDTLKAGDEVILIPVNDQQLYYVIDKAVRF